MSLEQDIKKDLEKFARNYLSQCAKIASERVYEKARYVLQEFYYSQYDPMYYARTDNLLFASYKKVKRVARYSSAGGVNISPELMWPYRAMGKNMTQEEIIDMSWGKGWHGFTRFEGQYQPMKPHLYLLMSLIELSMMTNISMKLRAKLIRMQINKNTRHGMVIKKSRK